MNDKVIFDELIKQFKIENIDTFSNYLTEIWKDLALRSSEKWKGINKITFSKYYGLPGIINDRLFAVFDSNNNEYIDPKEFLVGMTTLFSDNFDQLVKFIFGFYDFDRDGLIAKEDIRVVLSYVPIQSKIRNKTGLKYETQNFIDRIEAQDELYILLNKVFGDKTALTQDDFFEVIRNVNSDIFLFILLYLLDKRPFNNQTINFYERGASSSSSSPTHNQSKTPTNANISHQVIMSPSLTSKFSSPTLTQKKMQHRRSAFKSALSSTPILNLYSGKNTTTTTTTTTVNANTITTTTDSIICKKDNTKDKECIKETNKEDDTSEDELKATKKPTVKITTSSDHDQNQNKKLPHRRDRKALSNLEDKTPPILNHYINDIETHFEEEDNEVLGIEPISDRTGKEELFHEGYLYKITKTKKFKKLWFKLVCRDIYYFKSKEDKIHKGMHNLCGIYLEENKTINVNGATFYCFSIIYPKKNRLYYLDKKEEYLQWLKILRKAIHATPLQESYEIKDTLGKGKFGLVKFGIHKETQRKVAIKIMNKKDMTIEDLELVKTEIDILKISQHPNIIKLYDVFDNANEIYISKLLYLN